MNNSAPIIGIDLGTVQSCLSAFVNGKVEIIPNSAQGNSRTTPSYVTFHEDGLYTFGHEAKSQAHLYPETTIYDVKQMIGRDWTDKALQEYRKHWSFELVNELGFPKVKSWDRTRYPHEITARLLTQFRVMAENHLDMPIGKAVITVPTNFNERQRKATSEAAVYAGLEAVILNEPTAAAIAYSYGLREIGRNVLVYDISDRTFSASVVKVGPRKMNIVVTKCDEHIGYPDFDKLLIDFVVKDFLGKTGINVLQGPARYDMMHGRIPENTILERMKIKCIMARKELLQFSSTTMFIERVYGDKNLNLELTRDKLKHLYGPLVKKTLDVVDRALDEARLSGVLGKADIHDVILVGDPSILSHISGMIDEHFHGKKTHTSIHPEEVIAYGAAVQGHLLKSNEHFIELVSSPGCKMETTSSVLECSPNNKINNDMHIKQEVVRQVQVVTPSIQQEHSQETSMGRKKSLLELCDGMETQMLAGTVPLGALSKRMVTGAIRQARLAVSEGMTGNTEEQELRDLFISLNFKQDEISDRRPSNLDGEAQVSRTDSIPRPLGTIQIIGNCMALKNGTTPINVMGIKSSSLVMAKTDERNTTLGEVRTTCKIGGFGDKVFVGVKFRKQLALGSSGIKIQHVDGGEGHCDECKGRKVLFIPYDQFGNGDGQLFEIQ